MNLYTRMKISTKLIALILIVLTVCQDLAYSAPVTSGLTAETVASVSTADMTLRRTKVLSGIFSRLNLPDELGTIQRFHEGISKKVIFHIQDLHINEEAQLKIARIIQHLSVQYGTKLIQMEGASGELDHGLLSRFPSEKARRIAGRYFLREGMLTGPEFLAIAKRPDLVLYGVENNELYEKNRQSLLRALKMGEGLQNSIDDLKKTLNGLSKVIFSRRLNLWLTKRGLFENNKFSISEYVHFLKEISGQENLGFETPQIGRLLKMEELEAQMRLENPGIGDEEAAERIKEILKDEGGFGVGIFDEIKLLENKIEERLVVLPDEKRLYALTRIAGIYEKMFSLALTRDDVEFLYRNRRQFEPRELALAIMGLMLRHHVQNESKPLPLVQMKKALTEYELFYQTALSRDQALIDGALEGLKLYSQNSAVLVTGGFHTPAVEKSLKDKGFSFCTITPSISEKIDFTNDQKTYFKSMKLEKTPISSYAGTKDYALQLQVPSHLPTKAMLAKLAGDENFSELISADPRMDYLTAMMIDLAATGFRLEPEKVRIQNYNGLSKAESRLASYYRDFFDSKMAAGSSDAQSGSAFVPYSQKLGFGLRVNWKSAMGSQVSSRNTRSKSFSFKTGDGILTDVQILNMPELSDLAKKNFLRQAEKKINRFSAAKLSVQPVVKQETVSPAAKPLEKKTRLIPAEESIKPVQKKTLVSSPQDKSVSQLSMIGRFSNDVVQISAAGGMGLFSITADIFAVLTNPERMEAARSELRCGFLDYVGPRLAGNDGYLLPDEYLDGIANSTRILSGRGTQAYGFEVKAQDRKGNVVLLGLKDVNPKRAVLHDRLRQDIEGELITAYQSGYSPLDDLIDYSSHLRFGTSSEPSQLETHPHPSEEQMVAYYNWSDGSKKMTRQNKNFQVSVKHNGDNDGTKTEEDILRDHPIFAFGKEMSYNDIRNELNRILYKDQTKGDSPVIASMLALYSTQGRWDASVRLAYLMLAGELKDSFGGLTEPAQITKVVKRWGTVFEEEFLHHKDRVLTNRNGQWVPDADYLDHFFIPQLIAKIKTDPRIKKDKYLAAFSDSDLESFAQTAVFSFLQHNTYRAIQMMMATSLQSSTFGLSVNSTLEPRMKFWVAKGQPGTLGHNPKTGAYIAASDPGAVFGGLNQQSKFLTLNDDQGEIVRLNMKNARAPKLNIFSMASHRELSQEEIEARWAPIAGNPYITLPSRANSEQSNMKQDLSELNQVMAKVDDGFDVKHRANRKAPSNRLSADRFNAALIDMAHEHRAWREQKLQAWLKRGRKAKDFREERNQEADIVFIAEGPSFDVTIRKKQDLEAVMPGLHVQIVRGNEYMAKKDNYYSGNGSPFRIGPNTIIFSISQSGMTFSNVEAIRDAEIMRKNGKVRDVFIMTGEWFTILGRSLGQEYFPGSDFGGRIFSNMSGRRLSEAATMASATDFFFTKLFMDTFKVLGKEVPEGSLEYMPFNMKLTSHAIDRLEQEVSPLLKEGVSKITGTDANGKTVDSNINEALLGQGRDIANHVSEQFFSLVAVRLYTFFSVLFHLPIFQTIAFLFTFSMILMTEAESFVDALQSLPMLEIVMFFGVWFVAHVLDSIFYTFQDLFYTYWLRYVQGRAVLDRVGPRFLAIGSPHWSLLRDYFRAALLEAPAVLQLSGVDGRKVEGDFMHAFKDVPRGAIGFFQFDDSPESTTPVTLTAGAGKMSINQASGVRNWGAGPHILINTLNPAVASRYKYPPVTVSEGNEFADNDPALNNEAFRTFHSRWFNELKLLVAGQVVAAEMAEVLSKVEIPFYVRRSESWSASFLEMFANIFSRLYSRIALKAYSAMMQFWYRTPPMDRIFAPGKGQSGLTVFTTQLVAPRPNKTGEAARNIRAIAHALMREGLDESAPWIPKAGSDNEDRASVIAYVYAQLYNPRADRQPAFVNLRAPIEPSSPEMENITVPALAGSGERHPRRREFSWGGSAENNEGSARSEVRGDRSKLKLRLEQLEDRRFLANGAFEYYLPHPKAFSEFVDVDIQTQDEVFKELGGSPQAENVKVVIGEETVTVDENGPVTRIEFSYYVDEGLVRVSLDDFKYDKLGKPISFTYTESRDGKTVSRQIDGKFTEYDDKGRPVKGIAEDEKSQFKAVLRFSYPEAVKDSKVGVVQEAMITEKDGSKTIVKIDIETIKYQVDTSDEDNQAIENGTVIVSSSGGGGGSSDNSVSSNSGGNDEKKQSAFEELDLGGGSANPGMRPQDGLKLIPNFDLNPMPGAPGDYDLAEAEEEVENVATPENGADSPAAISALRAPAPSIDASNEPEVPVPGSWKSLDAIAAATLAVAAVFHVKKPSKKQTLLFWGSLGLIFAAGTVFAYFFASGLVPVIILAAVAFFYFTYHLEKQNTVRISVSRDGKTLNLFLPPSAGVQVRNRNVQLTFQRVGSEYRTSDGSLRALVNSTGREISFFHADDNQFPFISTNGEETFQRINVPVSRSVINKIQVVSSATRTQRGAAFKVSPAFLVKVLGYGLLTGLIAAFIWFGLPAIAAWSQISVPSVLLQQLLQNSSTLLFWGGILAPAAGFLWMLKEPRKKSARLSWVAWTRGWIFRAMFLAGVAALGYGALFLGLAPLSFIAASLWLFYGFIFIGYLIPNALGWFATVLSIPFRWMPRIYARSSLRQDLTAAAGIAAIVSGSYFGYRAYSVQTEDFERKIQNVTQNFSAAIWPKETFKPEKNSEDKIVSENSTAQVSLGIEEDSVLPAKFEFENIEPLLYSAGAEDITVSVISPKEGYLSLHPKSGIRTNEYQNPGKAFPLVGGEPLLHVERPVTQISAERQKVMAEYLKAVSDRFQPLWERGVMSERERLFYKSAHVLTSVENYDSAQEADVYGTIRVPLATGEKGFLLPSERPLGTTNGTTNSDESLILGRVHSQHRLTMRVAVPLSVWNQYDLTKIKTTVLFGGQQREARVVHLTAEPRLDGTLILTLGLLSKEQIFGWDFANSKPVPVSLLLNLQPKEDSSLYSNHLSEYVQVSSYAQLDDRKTFPVNSTDAIGRASFNVEESSWVSPKQIVAGVGEKDRERLKALIQQSKEYSQEVKRMLEAYLRLYYKGAMNAAPPEVRKFSEDVNRLSLLPGKWNTLDYEAPQVGIIHNTFNSEGQAVLGQPVAEILTPQITIHQRIEKRIGVNIGDIVIVRRPASEEETLGIVRQVNRELTNKDRGEDQKNFQEISIELNNTPRLWFFSGEYGVQVIYVPADKNGVKSQKAQEWLRGQYANLERERARIFSSANIQSLKPLYPMQFVTPASESDRLLLIKLLEAPLTSNETGEENIAFQNLPKALANEQRGDKDPQFSNEGNLELRRILNESNGGQRREWMRLYLQNQNIPLHDLKNIILYGPTDTAQMSLDYLLRQRRIADLVMIHRDLFAKSPELDMTKLARAHIIELIETDEDPLKRLVQLEHGDLKRAAAQEFLVSLISSEDAAFDPDLAISVRKVLSSSFWRTYADKLQLARALENVSKGNPLEIRRKKAAFLIRNIVFGQIAQNVRWAHGEPQEHAKGVGAVQRFDGWVAGWFSQPGVWDRLEIIEKSRMDDLEWLEHSPWVIAYTDPRENFNGRIHQELYDKALDAYEAANADAENTAVRDITVLDFEPQTGSFHSDHVYKFLDPLTQRNDYLQTLSLHALERLLQMSERPENKNYRLRREQIVDRLVKENTPQSKLLLARTLIKTSDREILQLLFDKHVDGLLIDEMNHLNKVSETEPGLILLYQQALAKLAGLKSFSGSVDEEGRRRLAIRVLLDTLTDFELKDLSEGRHQMEALLKSEGVNEEIIRSTALEQLRRHEMLWAIPTAASWKSNVTFKSQVFVQGEAALKNLEQALGNDNLSPERVEAALAAGRRDYPDLFRRMTALTAFRDAEIQNGSKRDHVGHLQTWRLSIGLVLGVIALAAGFVGGFISMRSSRPYSLNRRRGSFFPRFSFSNLFSFRTRRSQNRESAGEFETDSIDEENNDVNGEARSEVRKAPEALLQAVESKEIFLKKIRVQQELNFSIYKKLARERGIDFSKALLNSHAVIERKFLNIGSAHQNGEVILNYEKESHTENFPQMLAKFMTLNPGVRQMNLIKGSRTSNEDWNAFKTALRTMPGFNRLRVSFGDEKGFASLEALTIGRLKARRLSLDTLIQVLEPSKVKSEERKYYETFLMGAAALGKETIIVLGGDDPMPGVRQYLTVNEILETMFQAQRRVLESA